MKRTIINFSLLLVLSLAFMAASSMAQATTSNTVETIPISGTIIMPCNGEEVDFEGNLRTVTRFTRSNSGRVSMHYSGSINVHGIGRITGFKYIVGETWSINENYDESDSAPYNLSWVDNWRAIGRGGAPNFRGKYHVHTTVNAHGEPTSTRVVFTTDCNG